MIPPAFIYGPYCALSRKTSRNLFSSHCA